MTPLRYARTKLGISQQELADLAGKGVYQNTIVRIESGLPAPASVAKKLIPHLAGHITLMDLFFPEEFNPPTSPKKKKAA